MIGALLRLARFDKPVGIFLLWAPTSWALALAGEKPSLRLMILFFLGTVFMRAAGCVMNDIADRNIDWQVGRTKYRPLTAGEVSLPQALSCLAFWLFLALMVLLQLPFDCFYFAVIALMITGIYPFCKRFIRCPQLVLGLAFSVSIPMVFAAVNALADSNLWMLMAINILWVLAYDTQYAMVDRVDDLKIGVLSTAILFAEADRLIIGLLQCCFHTLWLVLAISEQLSWGFYLAWMIGLGILMVQQQFLATRLEANYFRAFSSNVWYGLVMWLGLLTV